MPWVEREELGMTSWEAEDNSKFHGPAQGNCHDFSIYTELRGE